MPGYGSQQACAQLKSPGFSKVLTPAVFEEAKTAKTAGSYLPSSIPAIGRESNSSQEGQDVGYHRDYPIMYAADINSQALGVLVVAAIAVLFKACDAIGQSLS
ncbi:hypothetical protein CKAH01_05671 [Colletotrichum kahawae]|uniref:Uncharacterized protein n=1 Tax=Colletotrichum kahawae TaxID=34407 RepID=A0AAD9YE03_COLKA|nr:hypothetical protein CKAH01_05671 [Colletotrichum kahawae]